MSTTLLSLPYENLVEIFAYIEPDKARRCNRYYRPTICALVQTCQQISTIARLELYRRIEFSINSADVDPLQPAIPCVTNFTRTCQEQPHILDYIQHVDIDWNLDDDDDDILEFLLEQLARSTTLTYLSLHLQENEFDPSISPCAIRPLLQFDHNYLHLRTLILISSHKDDFVQAEILYCLACLPSLHTLRVHCAFLPPGDNTFHISPDDALGGNLPPLEENQLFTLETLELVQANQDHVLGLLLSRCPNLSSLAVVPTGLLDSEYSYLFNSDVDGTPNPTPFSPKQMTDSLLPTAGTLTSLSLTGRPTNTSHHDPSEITSDNSIIHLSPFHNLKHLELSILLLSLNNPKSHQEEALLTMFPPSLEHLEVHFEYPCGIFHSAHRWATETPLHIPPPSEPSHEHPAEHLWETTLMHDPAQVHADLSWFLTLLTARKPPHPDKVKTPLLPNLQRMRIVELVNTGDDDGVGWSQIEFVGLGWHPQLFWGLDVDFQISLRVPRQWRVPVRV